MAEDGSGIGFQPAPVNFAATGNAETENAFADTGERTVNGEKIPNIFLGSAQYVVECVATAGRG
jgi:hypothetical protein